MIGLLEVQDRLEVRHSGSELMAVSSFDLEVNPSDHGIVVLVPSSSHSESFRGTPV